MDVNVDSATRVLRAACGLVDPAAAAGQAVGSSGKCDRNCSMSVWWRTGKHVHRSTTLVLIQAMERKQGRNDASSSHLRRLSGGVNSPTRLEPDRRSCPLCDAHVDLSIDDTERISKKYTLDAKAEDDLSIVSNSDMEPAVLALTERMKALASKRQQGRCIPKRARRALYHRSELSELITNIASLIVAAIDVEYL